MGVGVDARKKIIGPTCSIFSNFKADFTSRFKTVVCSMSHIKMSRASTPLLCVCMYVLLRTKSVTKKTMNKYMAEI